MQRCSDGPITTIHNHNKTKKGAAPPAPQHCNGSRRVRRFCCCKIDAIAMRCQSIVRHVAQIVKIIVRNGMLCGLLFGVGQNYVVIVIVFALVAVVVVIDLLNTFIMMHVHAHTFCKRYMN